MLKKVLEQTADGGTFRTVSSPFQFLVFVVSDQFASQTASYSTYCILYTKGPSKNLNCL